jgi:hypothetical protein
MCPPAPPPDFPSASDVTSPGSPRFKTRPCGKHEESRTLEFFCLDSLCLYLSLPFHQSGK